MELHGGGFAGKTHDSGDYPDPTFIDENVNPTSGTPNNLYIPNYTVSELGILTATLNAGSCSMSLASHYGCGGYWWPTGGTPFPILVDSGPNQESLVVTNMSGSCSAATWTLQSCATKTHTVSTWGLTSATPLGDGTQTVYTGTITGGANNALAGTIITTSGFVITGSLCPNYICNDGTYMVVSSTSTTLTVDNPYGVSETHAASATNHIYQWLTNVQPPVALRDLASFMSFLAHCAYGGTSYNSGTCASVAGAANMPGNPHQIIDTAGSAGGMWALLLLQGGCNNGSTCLFLDNNLADVGQGYTPWDDTDWAIANSYGMVHVGFSDAQDAPSVYARDTLKGRLWTLGGVYPPSLCGCVPSCDNGNPTSFNIETMTCNANPSSCYTSCSSTTAPYYMSSVLGIHVPVASWMCDGVGTNGVCNSDGSTTCGSGADQDFCEINCLMGTQPNVTTVGWPAGHGCNQAANIEGVAEMGLAPEQPTFTIAASPASFSIQPGNQGISTITAAISGGFNSAISLSASGVPPGTTVSFSPGTIPAPGSGNSTMTITVGGSTPLGTYPIIVTGNGGGIQQNITVTLTLTGQSQLTFTISASPASLSVQQGNQGTSTITTAISGGFNNAITLSASGAPSGTTVNFNPQTIAAPGSGNSTMTITVGLSTPLGTYPITVTGNGGGIQQNATVSLTVSAASGGWQQGFDFRNTSTYVSDPSGDTYVLSTNAYPTQRNGVTFGWVKTSLVQARDRSTKVDPRLAGINYVNNGSPATFNVDLPAAGSYNLSLAMGDDGYEECYTQCQVQFLDGSTVLATASGGASNAGYFYDAAGNNWSAAAWPGSNLSQQVTLTGSRLTVVVGTSKATGDLTPIAFLGVAQASSGSPSFTISASPASLSVQQGNQGTSTITTAISGGFNNAITLSASGAPSGTTVSFNPNPIAAPGSGNSTMTITVGSSTPLGTYPITVTGNGGGIQQNATVTLTVSAAPSFTISASPASLSVQQGNQGTSTITTAISGGFNNAITLSASGAPSGTTVSFNPNPIPAPGSGNSTMTITVGLSTPLGTYPITVTGNGGGIQQNTTVTLTVSAAPDFTIALTPSSVAVPQGLTGNSTVTTAIIGNFNSAITLSASGAPSGTTVSFNPNPIAAPGSGNSTMTITVGSSTPLGTYPITVTGNGGGIQHSATLNLTVTSWAQGFDFRNTAEFVTDLANYTYVLPGTTYPTTVNGVTFGWTTLGLVQGDDRSTLVDPRLAGINSAQNGSPATFYVNLPSPGTYNLTLAMGDEGYEECYTQCQVQFLDGSTVLATASGGASNAGYFYDAAGNNWSAAAWPSSNVSQQVTLEGNLLTVVVGTNSATGDLTPVASLGVTQTPSFTISASPASLSVQQGNQGTSTITTAISGGFNNAITLSASGAPSGTTVSFNPNPIAAPGSGNSTMTITVGLSTPLGTYPIIVTGNGGGIQQNATVTLTVSAAPSFTISASPASLSVQQGNQGTSTITTAISGGFNNAITLSASGAPSGTTVSFNPNPIPAPGSGNSTMTITVGSSTPLGTYPIIVTGDGGGIQQNTTVTLTVSAAPDFTIALTPSSVAVPQGLTGNSTVTTAIIGNFNSAITLSASGAPSGTTLSFNPNPIAAPGSGNSTMTITVGSSTPLGTYPITVTGNGGGIQQNATVTLTVSAAPSFTISASPASLSVQQGNQGTSTITTAISGGFNSAITLSASGAPSGTTVSFNPNPIAAPGSGNSTMTITVGSQHAAGNLSHHRDRKRRWHPAERHGDADSERSAELHDLGFARLAQRPAGQSRDLDHHDRDQWRVQQRDHFVSFGSAVGHDSEFQSQPDTGAGLGQLDHDHHGGLEHAAGNLSHHRDRRRRWHPAEHHGDADSERRARFHDCAYAQFRGRAARVNRQLHGNHGDHRQLQQRDHFVSFGSAVRHDSEL